MSQDEVRSSVAQEIHSRNLPWRIEKGRAVDCLGRTVADCRYVAKRGELIVRAVNRDHLFTEMLEALKAWAALIESGKGVYERNPAFGWLNGTPCMIATKDVIAKAEGQAWKAAAESLREGSKS